MNIIQLTDLHLCQNQKPAYLHADSANALRKTVDYLICCGLQIDMVVVSGDLSDDGSSSAYAFIEQELSRLPCPVYCVPGNHDNQENMTAARLLPKNRSDALCRKIETEEADIVLLDSTNPDWSNGLMNEEKAILLQSALRTRIRKPALLFLHHVPFTTGYGVMDLPFEGLELLKSAADLRDDLYICCGHIHAAITARLGKTPVITCPPVSMEMELDLTAQGGDTFYCCEPQFALHEIHGMDIITRFCTVPTEETRTGPYPFSI